MPTRAEQNNGGFTPRTTTASPTSTEIAGFPALRASGPPGARQVLFLHGAFGDHTTFANFLRRFAAAGFDAIAFARSGRLGLPPHDARGLTVADYADDVRTVLAAMPSRPVLIGHSLGGLLAQHMAVERRCSAAVLLSSAPPGFLTTQPRSLPALAPSVPRILLGLPFRPSDAAIEKIALGKLPKEDRARVLATLGKESGRVFRSMVFGTGGPRGRRAQCPMLVYGGGDDWLVSRRLLRATARAFGADLVIDEPMSHWLPEEPGWERVADRIIEWIAEAL